MAVSCKDYLGLLRGHLTFDLPSQEEIRRVPYVTMGCHGKYFEIVKRPDLGSVYHKWGVREVKELIQEILDVIEERTGMGVIRAFPIRTGESNEGMTLDWMQDRIFVQCGGVCHPFDVVATTLHELGHQVVIRTPHHGECGDGHCVVWQRCVRAITAIFAAACKSTHFLSRIGAEYGEDWSKYLLQSKFACVCCTKHKDEVEVKEEVLYTDAQLDRMLSEENIRSGYEKRQEHVEVLEIEEEEEDWENEEEGWEMEWREDEEEEGWQVHLDDDEEIDVITIDGEEEDWEVHLDEDGDYIL